MCTNGLLIAFQCPLVHILGLSQPALVGVEVSKVVDRAERRRVVWPERLLRTLQRPLVHLLSLGQPALVGVEAS